jgi:hypothetical protein
MTDAGVEIPYPKRDVTFTPAPPTDADGGGQAAVDAETEAESDAEADERVAGADD